MNSGFTLLWSKTLLSSLWLNESKETKILFFTMLMLKDHDGVVLSSVPGLAHASKLTVAEVEESLKQLLSKDQHDSSGVEGGIRIRVVPGGWQVVNHDLYRFSTEAKREFWRQQKAEQRARKPRRKNKVTTESIPQFPETTGEKIAKELHLGLAPGALNNDEDFPF
jgi:hypothetical protein